jgi:RHS repeat-associated protein
VTREYFTEGEYVPSSPAQPYYYGPDQIGSVRRVFASASSAPAYSYDAYGNALQGTAPLTDFNYAGLFYNADSGLYLTQYRAYDPVAARWLSRDPLDELGNQQGSTVTYLRMDLLGATVQLRSDMPPPELHDLPLGPDAGINSLAIGNNLYTYVDNNPVNNVDVNGLCPIQPLNWAQRCIIAVALACGINLHSHQPEITDVPLEPNPPIITPAPPVGRRIR